MAKEGERRRAKTLNGMEKKCIYCIPGIYIYIRVKTNHAASSLASALTSCAVFTPATAPHVYLVSSHCYCLCPEIQGTFGY